LDGDGHGYSDQFENGGPNNGDVNNDGVQDRLQKNITCLPNALDGRYVCGIVVAEESMITPVLETPSPETKPSGLLPTAGLFDFELDLPFQQENPQLVILNEAPASVTLVFPDGVEATSYYNFGPTPERPEPHWYEFLFDGETGAEIFADRIILHFVDGQRGDHDLAENGRITTLGGPVVFGFSLYFPFNRSDETDFTGFAVSNFSESETLLEMTAFDTEGIPLFAFDNPVYFQLQGGSQLARLGTDIFDLGNDTSQDGWVRLIAKEEGIGSFFQAGGGSKLDGSVAASDKSETLYFTRVFEGPTEYRGHAATTSLSIANPNLEWVTIDLELLGNPGSQNAVTSTAVLQNLAPRQEREIPPSGVLRESVENLFGPGLNVSSALVKVVARRAGETDCDGETTVDQCGVVGFELIELIDLSTIIGLGASTGNQQTDLFSAQLASIPPAIFTSLKVVNTSEENRSLTLTAVAEDGSDLAAPVQMNLAAGEFLEQDAGEVFTFDSSAVGSLRIEADGEGVIGDVIFGDPVGFNFAASLPLQTETFTEAVFSQVADLPGLFFTGLAFYNPGVLDAEVTIEIISANGELVGQATRVLEAGKRLSELTSQLVPDSAGQAGGYVLIRSDQPLIAQIIFGGLGPAGITLFSAVPPTVIQ
jgi:hypothetical protein